MTFEQVLTIRNKVLQGLEPTEEELNEAITFIRKARMEAGTAPKKKSSAGPSSSKAPVPTLDDIFGGL